MGRGWHDQSASHQSRPLDVVGVLDLGWAYRGLCHWRWAIHAGQESLHVGLSPDLVGRTEWWSRHPHFDPVFQLHGGTEKRPHSPTGDHVGDGRLEAQHECAAGLDIAQGSRRPRRRASRSPQVVESADRAVALLRIAWHITSSAPLKS